MSAPAISNNAATREYLFLMRVQDALETEHEAFLGMGAVGLIETSSLDEDIIVHTFTNRKLAYEWQAANQAPGLVYYIVGADISE